MHPLGKEADSNSVLKQKLADIRSFIANIRPIRIIYDDLYLLLFSRQVPSYLRHYSGITYSASGSGFSQISEVRRLARSGAIKGKRVLIVGVEHGREVEQLWVRERPKCLIGIDIGDYESDWSEIITRLQSKYPDVYRFERMNAEKLTFPEESFDLIYSQGVLPHIMDIPAFLSKASQVLSPEGIFYAFCCPLWLSFGGPHIGCLGFDHLLVSEEEFMAKARSVGRGWEYWLEQGLFNRLRFRDLLKHMQQYFSLNRIGVIGSPDAERFRKENPQAWKQLRAGYDQEDLCIRLAVFVGRKC